MKKMLFLTVLLVLLGLATVSSAFEVSVGTPGKDGGYHSGAFHSVTLQPRPDKESTKIADATAGQEQQAKTAKQ